MARTIRVYKDGQVWVAIKDGAARASAVRDTQREAYLAAREIAINQGLTITVYYPTGGIKAVINPRSKKEESDCFITTSCVKYFGLKDNCYELQTLRNFRDCFLLSSKRGKELVKQYYEIAPAIVQRMERHKKKNDLFKTVFAEIKKACQAIENRDFKRAESIYKSAVVYLFHQLKMS